MSPVLKQQIIAAVDRLTPAQQRELLNFAHALASKHEPGVLTREELMQFVGAIPSDDLERMERAIEEACERIEPDAGDVKFS